MAMTYPLSCLKYSDILHVIYDGDIIDREDTLISIYDSTQTMIYE